MVCGLGRHAPRRTLGSRTVRPESVFILQIACATVSCAINITHFTRDPAFCFPVKTLSLMIRLSHLSHPPLRLHMLQNIIMNVKFRGQYPHKWSRFCRFGAPIIQADVSLYEINTMGFYGHNTDIHETITTNQQVTLKRCIFTSTPFNKLFLNSIVFACLTVISTLARSN